jgi:hypothetical protein
MTEGGLYELTYQRVRNADLVDHRAPVGTSEARCLRARHRPNAESQGHLSGARPMCRPVWANSPPLAAFWRDVLCCSSERRSADLARRTGAWRWRAPRVTLAYALVTANSCQSPGTPLS